MVSDDEEHMCSNTFAVLGKPQHKHCPVWLEEVAPATCATGMNVRREQQMCKGTDAASLKNFTQRISTLGRRRLWIDALGCIELLIHGTIQPDVIIYSVASGACERVDRWEHSAALLRSMRDCRVEADVMMYNSAISAYGRCSFWAEAVALVYQMESASEVPDVLVHNAAMSSCSQVGQWVRSCKMFQLMAWASVQKDAITLSAMVTSSGVSQRWASTLNAVQLALDISIEPDVVFCNLCISACSTEWAAAVNSLQTVSRLNKEPSVISYSAAVSTCNRSKKWDIALALMFSSSQYGFGANLIASSATLLAATTANKWACASSLFDVMVASELTPNVVACGPLLSHCEQSGLIAREVALTHQLGKTYGHPNGSNGGMSAAVANAVAIRLLANGQAQKAAVELQSAAQQGFANAISKHLWSICVQEFPTPLAITGRAFLTATRSVGVLQFPKPTPRPGSGPYAKELQLLHYVITAAAAAGGPTAVCAAMEEFGKRALPARSLWLKIVGATKAQALCAAVCAASCHGSVLEVGTYCGYSAIQMAAALSGVRIVTLEVDPVHVIVARNLVALGHLTHCIDVWIGHSQDLLPRLGELYGCPDNPVFSAAFMDQRGSRYSTDVAALLAHNLLLRQAVVVADNVLKPGAPFYIWQLKQSRVFHSELVRFTEFAMQSEDWMSVSGCQWHASDTIDVVPEDQLKAPAKLHDLHRLAEGMREKARGRGSSVTFEDWSDFAQEMQRKLASLGLVATADASERSNPRMDQLS